MDWMQTKLNNEADPKNFARLGSPQIPNGRNSDTGQQLKEKGLKSVRENNENWMELCVSLLRSGFRYVNHAGHGGNDFTGEDIRFHCERIIGPPKHPNAYGALINTLIKRKIIVPTGEHRQMKDRSSHARSTPVYKAK